MNPLNYINSLWIKLIVIAVEINILSWKFVKHYFYFFLLRFTNILKSYSFLTVWECISQVYWFLEHPVLSANFSYPIDVFTFTCISETKQIIFLFRFYNDILILDTKNIEWPKAANIVVKLLVAFP